MKALKEAQTQAISILAHSSQIHQIHVKLKILKSLKYSTFDSLIENKKFQKF